MSHTCHQKPPHLLQMTRAQLNILVSNLSDVFINCCSLAELSSSRVGNIPTQKRWLVILSAITAMDRKPNKRPKVEAPLEEKNNNNKTEANHEMFIALVDGLQPKRIKWGELNTKREETGAKNVLQWWPGQNNSQMRGEFHVAGSVLFTEAWFCNHKWWFYVL